MTRADRDETSRPGEIPGLAGSEKSGTSPEKSGTSAEKSQTSAEKSQTSARGNLTREDRGVRRSTKSPVTVDIQRQAIVDFCRSIARNLNAPGMRGREAGERARLAGEKTGPSASASGSATGSANGSVSALRLAPGLASRLAPEGLASESNDASGSVEASGQSRGSESQRGAGESESPVGAEGSGASRGCMGVKWVDPSGKPLGPRLSQIMDRLLAGDGEKQVAAALGISQHTVHDHVKRLYRRFGVCSRSELLARFVRTDRAGPETR